MWLSFLAISSLWALTVNGQSVLNATREPTATTLPPTLRPSAGPTTMPTAYPTVSIPSGQLMVISANVPVAGVSADDVQSALSYFELLFADAASLDVNDVDIQITTLTSNLAAIEQTCNSSGTGIDYELITSNMDTYASFRLSIDTGAFEGSFNEGLANVYGATSFICVASSITFSYTLEDYDDVYRPTPEPTLTEQLWSEYLFFGFFTSLVGVVWLWYLRSDVDDENIYNTDSGPARGAGGKQVEMTAPNTTAAGNSSNALLDDTNDGKLSDYAIKDDDGQLVLDQRDSQRSP